jgi:hypothetical protein
MRRRLITTGLLLGAIALVAAACGTSDPQVQARQTGDTTTTTTEPTTTTEAPSTTAAPDSAAPPVTTAPQPPCTPEALAAAYAAKFGPPSGTFKPQQCAAGWATSSLTKGFSPPTFTLYQAEGDHWVALNRSAGKLCEGQGVPAEIAPRIGCDT